MKHSSVLDRLPNLDSLVPLPEGHKMVARGLYAAELGMDERVDLVQEGRQRLLGPEREASVRREALEGARSGTAVAATGVLGVGVGSALSERAARMSDDARLDIAAEVLFNALSPDAAKGLAIPSNIASHIPVAFDSTAVFKPGTERLDQLLDTASIEYREQSNAIDRLARGGSLTPEQADRKKRQMLARITRGKPPKDIPRDMPAIRDLMRETDARFASLKDPGSWTKSDLKRFIQGPLRAQHGAADDIIGDIRRGFVQHLTDPEPKHGLFRGMTPLDKVLLANKVRTEVESKAKPGDDTQKMMRNVYNFLRGDSPEATEELRKMAPWRRAGDQMAALEGDELGNYFKAKIRDPAVKARRWLATPMTRSMGAAPQKVLQVGARGGLGGAIAGTIAAKVLQAVTSRGGGIAALGGLAGAGLGAMKQDDELSDLLRKSYQTREDVRGELEGADELRALQGAEDVQPGRELRESIPRLRKSIRRMRPDHLADVLQTATAVNVGLPGFA